MNIAEAKLHLGLLHGKTPHFDAADFFARLINKGLPPEVTTRLFSLADYTRVIGGQVIAVGKIILMEVWEFIKAHPNLTIGAAVGAGLSALVQMIPFLGPLLAPILIPLGAFMGALAGHRLDKHHEGARVDSGIIGATADAITMAREFFRFFVAIFRALREHFRTGSAGGTA